MRIIPLNMHTAKRFVCEYHYTHDWGSIPKIAIGLEYEGDLVGVAIWGYGTRPLHTIRRCFPSLEVEDYLELNRFCVLDLMPRNTESQFISQQVNFIKKNLLQVKLLFSWADGLRNKPGFVYQSASWLYGGYIDSEFYITNDGDVVHPRLLISREGHRDKLFTQSLGLRKVHGPQFRYCKFLCGHAERKRLLDESPFKWTQDYPKLSDIHIRVEAGEGSRESYELPKLKGSGQFRHPAPLLDLLKGG